MAEISSGILRNATPLTTARIKELEAEVLNQKSGFAYLDENSDLCFALPCAVDGIKELAWDNAYELIKEYDVFTKKAYKKTGLKTFELATAYGKTAINADWQEGGGFAWPELTDYEDATPYLEFEVNEEDMIAETVGYTAGLPSILKLPGYVGDCVMDEVSKQAFSECNTLQEVWFSSHAYSIGVQAFQQCPNLTAVYFPRQCNQTYSLSIKRQAFLNCTKLTSVYLPVLRIADWAGAGFEYFKLSIGSGAFKGCTALTNIVYGGTMAEWMNTDLVQKTTGWAEGVPATYVQCSDGRVDIATGEPLEGSGQEFYNTAPTMLSFRSPEPLSEFNEVLVNGEVVDPSNYDLEEGSTIVKLSVDYLKTLPVGEYGIQVVSTNNAPTGTFTVSAPELNEHGFYYNQPYCANVPYLGGDTVVFIRADGTLDLIVIEEGRYYSQTCTYIMNNKGIVITDANGTSFNTSFSDDGNAAYVAELDATFALGNGLIAADNDYIYTYNYELGGYEVSAIDKTKASYGAIKTGVNGIATVKIAEHAFYNNKNMTAMPVLPDSITAVGDGAFEKCSSLEYVEIPDSVTTVGAYAFNECTSLEGAVIGSGVIDTGYYIFARSNKLESLVYNGTVAQWQAVTKASPWYYDVSVSYLQCSDGNESMPVIKY